MGEQGEFSFYEKTWKNITSSAKQLITDLLQVDPTRRPSALDVTHKTLTFALIFMDYCYLDQIYLYRLVIYIFILRVHINRVYSNTFNITQHPFYSRSSQVLNHPWVMGELAKEEQMDPEIMSRLQSFNARRKLRAAAIASVWSSTIFLRTKKLKSLLGSHDLKEEEIENLRLHFTKL